MSRKVQGRYTQSYLPLGDLAIRQDLKDGTVTGYRRELDIRDAIQRTTFTVNGCAMSVKCSPRRRTR